MPNEKDNLRNIFWLNLLNSCCWCKCSRKSLYEVR
nr:MAG TPA: hypothetical protein [Caudoviricetes sp.]